MDGDLRERRGRRTLRASAGGRRAASRRGALRRRQGSATSSPSWRPCNRCACSSLRSTRILRTRSCSPPIATSTTRGQPRRRRGASKRRSEDILAGRDLAAGGTWLGVRRDGRFALVTNVRDGKGQDPAARSRGELVPRVLDARTAQDAVAAVAIDGARYNGFNLLTGDATRAWWMSNRSRRCARDRGRHARPVQCASRRAVAQARAHPGTPRGVGKATATPISRRSSPRSPTASPRPTRELPSTGVTLERERLLSSPFIVSEAYGTRCSTVFTVDRARARPLRRAIVRTRMERRSARSCEDFEHRGALGQRPHHRLVRNACFQELLARRREAVARVERHRLRLARSAARACRRAPWQDRSGAASSAAPTPCPRQSDSTATRPMWPSGSSRPQPIGTPARSSASACTLTASNSSHSSSSGMFCSTTKTATRTARSFFSSLAQSTTRIVKPSADSTDIVGEHERRAAAAHAGARSGRRPAASACRGTCPNGRPVKIGVRANRAQMRDRGVSRS